MCFLRPAQFTYIWRYNSLYGVLPLDLSRNMPPFLSIPASVMQPFIPPVFFKEVLLCDLYVS